MAESAGPGEQHACARRGPRAGSTSSLRAYKEEVLGSRKAGVVATVVAMATEPEAEGPAVPSLVDRYFTRWYKAGKRGVM